MKPMNASMVRPLPALACLAALLAMSLAAQADPLDSILPATQTWQLNFEDTFDPGQGSNAAGTGPNASGDDLNEQVWTYTDGEYLPGFIDSARFRNNIVVEDGLAKLITRREQTTDPDSGTVFEWTSAHMFTRTFNQEFGYFEARMRIADADGQNNAFWLTKVDDAGNAPLELDIAEAHYPTFTTANLHDRTRTPKYDSSSGNIDTGVNIAESFNLFGLEWTPDVIRWYFNGTVVREFVPGPDFATNNGSFPLGVRFSTALLPGGFDGDPVQNPDGSWELDGASMDVDWVRVYESTGEIVFDHAFEDFDGDPDGNNIDDQLAASVRDFLDQPNLRVEGFETRDLDTGEPDDGVSTIALTDPASGETFDIAIEYSSGADPQRFDDDAAGSPTPTGLSHRLSGFGFLRDDSSDGDVELLMTLTADPLVALQGLGIVALSDETRGSYTISGLVELNDGTIIDLGSMVLGENGVSDDAFVGYIDETGVGIRSLTLTASGASADLFPAFDELAFVAVPEPGAGALIAIGGLAMLTRRRCGRGRS